MKNIPEEQLSDSLLRAGVDFDEDASIDEIRELAAQQLTGEVRRMQKEQKAKVDISFVCREVIYGL